jgi:hypothetical protein
VMGNLVLCHETVYNGPPGPECNDRITSTSYNIGTDGCAFLPRLPDAGDLSFDHPPWMMYTSPSGGVKYGNFGTLEYTEGWTNVSDFFEPFSAVPEFTDVSTTGTHLCAQTAYEIDYIGTRNEIIDSFIPTDFVCWQCRTAAPWVPENSGLCDGPPGLTVTTFDVGDPFEEEYVDFILEPAGDVCAAEDECPPDTECEYRCHWVEDGNGAWELGGPGCFGVDCECDEPADPPVDANDEEFTECTPVIP